jgi:hypothetical protein
MKIQTALESATNYAAVHKIADCIEPHLSFLGGAYLYSKKHEGAVSIDDLILRIGKLIKKTPRTQSRFGDGFLRLNHKERFHAKALAKRVENLYVKYDAQIDTSNIFTRILFAIRESWYILYTGKFGWFDHHRNNWKWSHRFSLSGAKE